MVNLYKPYFQPIKKFFIPPLFYSHNQTQMKKTKNFSIFLLFHSPSIFYPLTFPFSQSNGYSLSFFFLFLCWINELYWCGLDDPSDFRAVWGALILIPSMYFYLSFLLWIYKPSIISVGPSLLVLLCND